MGGDWENKEEMKRDRERCGGTGGGGRDRERWGRTGSVGEG